MKTALPKNHLWTIENSNSISTPYLKLHESPAGHEYLVKKTKHSYLFFLFHICQISCNLGLPSPLSKLPCPLNPPKQFICKNKDSCTIIFLCCLSQNGPNFILPSKENLVIKLLIILLKSNVH